MAITRNQTRPTLPKRGPIVVNSQGQAKLPSEDVQAKAGTAQAQTKVPLDQMEKARTGGATQQVKSMGLRSAQDADAAIARLKPALALAQQSLGAFAKLSSKEGVLKKSAQWEQRAVGTQVDALKSQLSEAGATKKFGSLLVDAAKGGRVSTEGKLQGEDLQKLDALAPQMSKARQKGATLEQTAKMAAKTADAFGQAESMLEQFGVSAAVDLPSKEAAVGKASARLADFDAQLKTLGGMDQAPAEMRPQLRALGGQLRADLGGAQKALLAESSKEDLLNRAATVFLQGPADANAQRGMVADLSKIKNLLTESTQLGQVSAKNVADLHSLRFANTADLGGTAAHQKRSTNRGAGGEGGATNSTRGTTTNDAGTSQSAKTKGDAKAGYASFLKSGLGALDDIFPGAQSRAEQNITWVSDFLSEAGSKIEQKGWLSTGKDFVSGLNAQLDEQDRQLRDAQEAASRSV